MIHPSFYSPELVVNMISVINNPLTKREIEILNLAQSGLNSKEIATKLFLSDGTVFVTIFLQYLANWMCIIELKQSI